MKLISVIALVSTIGCGLAGTASAASIQSVSPSVTSFTATGLMTLVGGGTIISCNAAFTGTIDNVAGTAQIASASFSGGPLNVCIVASAGALPVLSAPNLTTVNGSSISVSAPVVGVCGSGSLTGTWDNALKVWTVVSNPLTSCRISLRLSIPNMQVI